MLNILNANQSYNETTPCTYQDKKIVSCPLSKEQKIVSTSKDVDKLEPSALLVGM
jgi:hypothetical protein